MFKKYTILLSLLNTQKKSNKLSKWSLGELKYLHISQNYEKL